MISGFGSLRFPADCTSALGDVPVLRERGMKKHMKGMVALCAALSVIAGSSALLAQKAADKKPEAKRSKAEQVDIDTLVTVVDNVAAGRLPAPADIAVNWDS